jgi:hypothetical protein
VRGFGPACSPRAVCFVCARARAAVGWGWVGAARRREGRFAPCAHCIDAAPAQGGPSAGVRLAWRLGRGIAWVHVVPS